MSVHRQNMKSTDLLKVASLFQFNLCSSVFSAPDAPIFVNKYKKKIQQRDTCIDGKGDGLNAAGESGHVITERDCSSVMNLVLTLSISYPED